VEGTAEVLFLKLSKHLPRVTEGKLWETLIRIPISGLRVEQEILYLFNYNFPIVVSDEGEREWEEVIIAKLRTSESSRNPRGRTASLLTGTLNRYLPNRKNDSQLLIRDAL
jgi:hypothetical protein